MSRTNFDDNLRILSAGTEANRLLIEVKSSFLDRSPPCKDDRYLKVAVSSLQLFVQHNWTGPLTLDGDDLAKSLSCTTEEYEVLEKLSSTELSVDSEQIYERTRLTPLLALSRYLFSCNIEQKSAEWLLWQMRSIYIHQCMIDEKCFTLKNEALDCIKSVMSMENIFADQNSNSAAVTDLSLAAAWKLEAAHISRYYFDHQTCKTLLSSAEQESGLSIKFDGIPGKRTRYQQKDITQLILQVHSTDNTGTSVARNPDSVCPRLPKIEPLQDDTVLEKIQFSEDAAISTESLTAQQQCLILALCEENKYVKEKDDDITNEETLAYLNYVLADPVDWSVQAKALLWRSVLEKTSGRRIERSVRQLEELTNLTSYELPDVRHRLRSVYTSCLPPNWQLQRSLGELHMDIGAYASAMEIFDRLSLWAPLIVCSQRAGRLGKAEGLIRDRLAIEETPALYCSLSDVTSDIQYYQKAWDLSNHRSARAMRGLAFHYLRACQYEDAMRCFEQTLALNPLHIGCWFSYGCASLASKNYAKAATAFQRCVSLETDNFEAWNNLAAAYARNQQKPRAFAVLKDALKHSFDNWKVWENYVLIGCDCGEISEVIRGAHRILELKDKWLDEQVVEHLTKCVIENVTDAQGRPAVTHKKALLELLGHTTAKVTNSSMLWACYGQLILSTDDLSSDHQERGIQCLQKAYRCACTEPSWERDVGKCEKNTSLLIELIESYVRLGTKRHIGTAKLQLKGHIAKLQQAHTDPVTKQLHLQVQSLVSNLENALNSLPTNT